MTTPRALASLGVLATIALSGAPAGAVGQLSTGSLDAGSLSLPSGPASLRGLADEATVTAFTGQASYEMAFELPAGPGGFRPSLALSYDGSLGNGPFGVGWSLRLPHLRRSTRLGVPSYTSADEIELVGVGTSGRLVPAGDGTFRVEGGGQSVRVQFIGNAALVHDANGVQYLMGFTPATRVLDGQRIFKWMVQQIVHPSGDMLHFVYQRVDGRLELQSVRWGISQSYRADFFYHSRPDPFTSYRSGFALGVTRRFDRLDVVSFGRVRRRFVATWDDSTPLSRLLRIDEKGLNGRGQMPPVTFSYGQPEPATTTSVPGTAGWGLWEPHVTLMDVDGDGISDLVRLAPTGHTYRRNLITHFAAPAPIPSDAAGNLPSMSSVRLMDVQGRVRPALVHVVANTWRVHQLEQSGWASVGAWQNTAGVGLRQASLAFADINGDRRTDLLQGVAANLQVRLGEGQGLSPTSIGASPAPGIYPGAPNVQFRDFTGDGLADAVALGLAWADVYPGKGDGTFAAARRIHYPSALAPASLADLRLGDLNRDGVTDFVLVSGAHVIWFPLRPGGVFMTRPDGSVDSRALPRPAGVGSGVVVAIADANGNGSEDVLWSSPAGFWVLDLAGATSASMLTAIQNGLGATTSLDYEASAAMALADELDPATAPWAEQLPVSVPVVVEQTVALASGEPDRRTTFDVRDGFWDYEEHRFGGFLESVRTDHGAGSGDTLITTTTFLEGRGVDRVLRGRPARVERRSAAGTRVDETVTLWQARLLTGLDPTQPLLRRAVPLRRQVYHFDGAATPIEVRTDYAYDGDGNPTLEHHHGDMSRSGDETITTRSYASNPARWVRGRILDEQLSDASGAVLERTRFLYDGGGAPLPHGQIDRGWLRRVEGHLASTGQWVLRQALDYDAHQNVTRRYEDGVWREIAYDAYKVHPVVETVQPNPSTQLRWTVQTIDYGLGVPTETEDANGVARTFGYDDLGRIESVAIAGAPAHLEYRYDWTAPRPQTTTVFKDSPAPDRTIVEVMNSRAEDLAVAQPTSGNEWLVSKWLTYDPRGRVTRTAEPFAHRGSALPSGPPAGTPAAVTDFDAVGRVKRTVDPTGAVRAVTRGPLWTSTLDPDLGLVTRHRDGLGRVVRTERALATGLETADTTYDAAGRVRSFSIQGGLARHEFDYDSLGRLTSAQDPDAGHRRFAHDAAGRVTRYDNAVGEWVRYGYDDAGRTIVIEASDGTRYDLGYDQGASGMRHTMGRLATVTEPTGDFELGYDAHGNPIDRQRRIDGYSVRQTDVVSPSGRVVESTFDDGFRVRYDYDGAGRLSSIGRWWTAGKYDAAGRLLGELYGNGVTRDVTYDARGHTDTIRVEAGGRPLLDLDIDRNGHGAPTRVRDRDRVGVDHDAEYRYDLAGRITRASLQGRTLDLSYDALQNLTGRTVTGPAVPGLPSGTFRFGQSGAGPRQLTSDGGSTYSYDAAGRMDKAAGRVLSFDGFDRLRRVDFGSQQFTEHRYGYDGVRVRTEDDQGTIERRFSELVVMDGFGNRIYYLAAGRRNVARVDRATGDVRYFHAGLNPGPALVTDHRGRVLDERIYAPFGTPIAANYAVDPYGAGNEPVDLRTGWSDHGARWLDPGTGRWHSPDPPAMDPNAQWAAEPWRLHPYHYVRSSPLLYVDPDGLQEKSTTERDLRGDHPLGGGYDGPTAETLLLKEVKGIDKEFGGGGVSFKLKEGRDGKHVQMKAGRLTVGTEDSEFDRLSYQGGGRAKVELTLAEDTGGLSNGVEPKLKGSLGVAVDMVEDHTRQTVRARLEIYLQITGGVSWKTPVPGVKVTPKTGARLTLLRFDSRVAMDPSRPGRYVRSPANGGGLGRKVAGWWADFERWVITRNRK